MLYRLYHPADFEPLYAIEEICFQPPFRFSRAYVRHLVRSLTTATWIAEENRQIAGFAIIDLDPAAGKPVAYIQTIEVTPERRGHGIGAELLGRIEASARQAGARSVWLHVDAENSAAIRLYEAHGYVREGRAENYYARNRAAFVYAKPMSDLVPGSAHPANSAS
jgi:[ribosomal protein S18]-alanine N-acetyltransferase